MMFTPTALFDLDKLKKALGEVEAGEDEYFFDGITNKTQKIQTFSWPCGCYATRKGPGHPITISPCEYHYHSSPLVRELADYPVVKKPKRS